MTTEQLYNLSYDEVEKYYSEKEQQYLPAFLIQNDDLYTFLSKQSDSDLQEEEILDTLFVRISLSDRVMITDETSTHGNRDYALVVPEA